MPSESGFLIRIANQKEVMVSLGCLSLVLLTLLFSRSSVAVILLNTRNESRSFPDMEAAFSRRVPDGGVSGILHIASPLDACSPLKNHFPKEDLLPPFVLISRGTCNFDKKVKNAQDAGFQAAIVYNSMDSFDELVTMSGSGEDIDIYAVFVSWITGQALLGAVGEKNTTCTLQPAVQDTAWSIMAVSSISLLAISAVLSTFFFVRRHRLRHLGSRLLSREPSGMNARDVHALPTFVFKGVDAGDGVGGGETCAICLEDYESGEKLRQLPCHHDFHIGCIDQWLLTRRPFCPICKQDANAPPAHPVATETTPLLDPPSNRAVSVPITNSAATQTSPLSSPVMHTTQSLPANVSGDDLC